MPFADRSSAKSWRREALSPDASFLTPSGLRVAKWNIAASPEKARAKGAKILFVTDLHLRSEASFSLSFSRPRLLKWCGLRQVAQALKEAVEISAPDYLVFGGDLVVHSCLLEDATAMLAELAPGIPKVAVYGNWDKRRRRWLPNLVWEELYEKAGFSLLLNETRDFGPLGFSGLDDFKLGAPAYRGGTPDSSKDGLFKCVVSHNPDSIARAFSDADLANVDLILCGHTHGGQWRLPFFGAFITSSRHWKRFELGLFKHENQRSRMLICAGFGCTGIRCRLNCPPELALLEIT